MEGVAAGYDVERVERAVEAVDGISRSGTVVVLPQEAI